MATPTSKFWKDGAATEGRPYSCSQRDAASSLLQLLQKIRQIKELFLPLNIPVLVRLEEADALQEEDVSALRGKT